MIENGDVWIEMINDRNLTSQMIDLLRKLVEDDEVNEYIIEGTGELLLEVKDKNPLDLQSNPARPITSIARSSLFIGSKVESSLYWKLK